MKSNSTRYYLISLLVFLSVGPFLAIDNDILLSLLSLPVLILMLTILVYNVAKNPRLPFIVMVLLLAGVFQLLAGVLEGNDIKYFLGDAYQYFSFPIAMLFAYSSFNLLTFSQLGNIYKLAIFSTMLYMITKVSLIVLEANIGYSFVLLEDRQIFRVFDPYMLSIVFIVTLSFYLTSTELKYRRKKILQIIMFSLIVFILFSAARGVWLATLIGAAIVSLLSNSIKQVSRALVIPLLLIGLLFVFSDTNFAFIERFMQFFDQISEGRENQGINTRLLEVETIFNLANGSNKIIGYGFGATYNFYDIQEGYLKKHYIHTTFSQLLLRGGYLGVALFFFSVLFILKKLYYKNTYMLNNMQTTVVYSAIAITVSYSMISFGAGLLLSIPFVFIWGVLIGMALAISPRRK